MTEQIRFVLLGLGNIGRNLLDILVHRQKQIEADYGLSFVLVGAVDSSGAAVSQEGLDMARVRDLKLGREGVADYPGMGRRGMVALEVLESVRADVLVGASPTNLRSGEPGLSAVRFALNAGMDVVMADKGPLVLAYQELMALAKQQQVEIRFSGTVAGGLPTVNLGVRDLAGSGILRVEGIFNGTTNYILTRMEQEQISYEEALAGAQKAGIAEADPTLDVDGWDAANKLVIIANSALKRPTKLSDLTVEGIRNITLEDLQQARREGKVIKPLAMAVLQDGDYQLSVKPVALDARHPLAMTNKWDMGVVYYSDYMGVISAIIEEKGPVPTSAAVLRDMINIYSN
ncbi:MAG: homoserine dehydrogenase [Chloroflexi bacterium]|jgi:homoserine dehydrogenase|nr:homoserine dehydrogenase [Chloroflexota bacterium]